MARICNKMRDQAGGSAVEFALVFPLLVMLMFIVVAIGQAFYAVAGTQWAVERSVRALMIDGAATAAEVEAEIRRLMPGLARLEVQIGYEGGQSGNIPTGVVRANVSYPVAVPFLTSFQLRYRIETTAPRPF